MRIVLVQDKRQGQKFVVTSFFSKTRQRSYSLNNFLTDCKEKFSKSKTRQDKTIDIHNSQITNHSNVDRKRGQLKTSLMLTSYNENFKNFKAEFLNFQ